MRARWFTVPVEKLDAIRDGSRVTITWGGGNGPHEYVMRWDGEALIVFTGDEKYEVATLHIRGNPVNYTLFQKFEVRFEDELRAMIDRLAETARVVRDGGDKDFNDIFEEIKKLQTFATENGKR